jgi:hypothetical protein
LPRSPSLQADAEQLIFRGALPEEGFVGFPNLNSCSAECVEVRAPAVLDVSRDLHDLTREHALLTLFTRRSIAAPA